MDFKQKAVIFGSGAVGKTALALRYLRGTFMKSYEPTLEDKYFKETNVDGNDVMIEVLDTAGQEDLITFRNMYIKLYDGFIIVYDITSRESFNEVERFVEEILRVSNTENEHLDPTNQAKRKISLPHIKQQNKQEIEESNEEEDIYIPPLVLIGNKCDMESDRKVSYDEGKTFADKYGMNFIETSAKTDHNVDKTFLTISREIFKKPKPQSKNKQEDSETGRKCIVM